MSSLVLERSSIISKPLQKRTNNQRQQAMIGLLQSPASKVYAEAIDTAEQLLMRGFPATDVARMQQLTKIVVDKLGHGLGRSSSTRCGCPPKSCRWFVETPFQHMWGSMFLHYAMRLRETMQATTLVGKIVLDAIVLTELHGGPMPGDLQKVRVLIVGLEAVVSGEAMLRECPAHRVPFFTVTSAELAEGGRARGHECPLCTLARERKNNKVARVAPAAPRDIGQASLEASVQGHAPAVDLMALA